MHSFLHVNYIVYKFFTAYEWNYLLDFLSELSEKQTLAGSIIYIIDVHFVSITQ